MCEPVRNVFMMCTVGFIFISGWFGVHLSIKKLLNLVGIAVSAVVVTLVEDCLLNGSFTLNVVSVARGWWFLNAYLALLILSPIFNSIAKCLCSGDFKARREAMFAVGIFAFVLYGLAWPMKCGWIPAVRFVCTWGFPAQFGTMCTIYLLGRLVALSGIYERIGKCIGVLCLVVPIAMAQIDIKFTYYNSPLDFVFAFGLFYFFRNMNIRSDMISKAICLVSPSLFFVYLYHSHQTPGFVILEKFQTWMVDGGIPVLLAWVLAGVSIFVIGIAIDSVRRGMVCACRVLRSGRMCANR